MRDTTQQAWADAEVKVARMADGKAGNWQDHHHAVAVGQQRLLDLAARGDVLDDNLYTAPSKCGGGGASTTLLVGSPKDVARSLRKYEEAGISHFVLSDTPYLRRSSAKATFCFLFCGHEYRHNVPSCLNGYFIITTP